MKNRVLETLAQTHYRAQKEETSTSTILDLISDEKLSSPASFYGVLVGKLAGFDEKGMPLVSFISDAVNERIVARSTIALMEDQIGSDVVVAFENGDQRKPIITGSLWHSKTSPPQNVVAELDPVRIALTAEKEVVLQCGKASILLRSDGKVIIKGAEILSRASGLNKIKGAAVQIN